MGLGKLLSPPSVRVSPPSNIWPGLQKLHTTNILSYDKEIFYRTLKTTYKTYMFTVKESETGNKYVKVVEKQDREWKKIVILVNLSDLSEFVKSVLIVEADGKDVGPVDLSGEQFYFSKLHNRNE